VQVKRYRNTIQVEQLRSFVGALVLEGITAGIFVTTSDFTSGAPHIERRSVEIGALVELMDGRAFLQALQLVQKVSYTEDDVRRILTEAEYPEWS
jgi:restriction endonuclease Mrr